MQKIDLKILLATHEVVAVSVCKTSTTPDVYNATVEKIGLDKTSTPYFAIFEIVEYNFGICLFRPWLFLPLTLAIACFFVNYSFSIICFWVF